MLVACGGGELPPDAFGVFADRNNAAFDTKLNVSRSTVTLYVNVTLPGLRSRDPLQCRAQVLDGITRRISLSLDCAGELVPYEFEWRDASADWVATEQGGTPQILSRFEGR